MYISSSTIPPSQSRVEVHYSISSILLFEGSIFFATLKSASSGSATGDFLFSVSLGRSALYGHVRSLCGSSFEERSVYGEPPSHDASLYPNVHQVFLVLFHARGNCPLVEADVVPSARVLLRTQLQAPYAVKGIFLWARKVDLGEGYIANSFPSHKGELS